MLRNASLALLVLLMSACKPALVGERSSANMPGASTAAPDELPALRMLPWGTELARAPGGPTITLEPGGEGSGRGRAVRVLAERDGWWQVETIAEFDLKGFVGKPIEQLEIYHLKFWVPVGVGAQVAEIPAGPEASAAVREAELAAAQAGILGILAGDPPLQAGERPAELASDWRIDAGTPVFWPDGSEAGQVSQTHAFAEPGRAQASDTGELLCFAFVFGPTLRDGGELCFRSESVYEGHPMASALATVWGSDDSVYDTMAIAELDAAAEWGVIGGVEGGVMGGIEGGVVGGGGMLGGEIGTLDEGEGAIGTMGHGGGGGGIGGLGYADEPTPRVESNLPSVELRGFSFSGGSPDAAERIVKARTRTIASCVGQASAPAGKLEIELRVGDDGKVDDVSIANDNSASAFERCARDSLARWRFGSGSPGVAKFTLTWD
jgi:hypothetical protein